MVLYAVKIGRKYFNGYVYANESNYGRFGGHTCQGGILNEGDVVDVILSDKPERTETKRSIGNTISFLYGIEKIKNKKILIEPREG